MGHPGRGVAHLFVPAFSRSNPLLAASGNRLSPGIGYRVVYFCCVYEPPFLETATLASTSEA